MYHFLCLIKLADVDLQGDRPYTKRPDLFRDLFKRSNARIKCRLVDLISRLCDPGMEDFLMEILKEEFFTVRCWAVRALGESGVRKAIPALLKVQKEDPSKEVRKEAGLALKRIKDIA